MQILWMLSHNRRLYSQYVHISALLRTLQLFKFPHRLQLSVMIFNDFATTYIFDCFVGLQLCNIHDKLNIGYHIQFHYLHLTQNKTTCKLFSHYLAYQIIYNYSNGPHIQMTLHSSLCFK